MITNRRIAAFTETTVTTACMPISSFDVDGATLMEKTQSQQQVLCSVKQLREVSG